MSKLGARLERSFATGSCGPGCPPQVLVHYEQDGPDAEPVLCEEPEPVAPCPRCGRPAKVAEDAERCRRKAENAAKAAGKPAPNDYAEGACS
jgi:hypothetical protein